MIPPREAIQFNIYKSHQFISDKGTIGKEGEWDGWTYGIDTPNSNTGEVEELLGKFGEILGIPGILRRSNEITIGLGIIWPCYRGHFGPSGPKWQKNWK